MDTTTATSVDAYEAYLRKMHGILTDNFSNRVPPETRRSGGLEPQAGLVLGLMPDQDLAVNLCNLTRGLPGAWSLYGPRALHSTFLSREDKGDSTPSPALWKNFEHLRAAVQAVRGNNDIAALSPMLTDAEVLLSGDTLVVAGRPNHDLFALRQHFNTSALHKAAGTHDGWGAHLTLARTREPLSTADADMTNEVVTRLQRQLDDLDRMVEFPNVMAGLFVVADSIFDLDSVAIADLN